MAKLSLNDIVNIVVDLAPRSAVRKGFNLGLIVGTSDVISGEDRVKIFSSLDSVAEAGFKEDMPEYKAASLYFSQSKKPTSIAIGRHVKVDGLTELDIDTEIGSEDGKFSININANENSGYRFVYKTAVNSITTPEYEKELTNWSDLKDGDEITATAGHVIVVAGLDTSNRVKQVGKATIGGEKISLDLPAGESLIDAIRACRTKNTDWYMMTYCEATREDIESIARYIETATPSSVYAFTTNEEDALKGSETSIFATFKDMNYQRTIGQYSMTPDAIAGIMGYAMGANTKTSNSAYTLMHKRVTGILPDDLDDTQVNFLQKQNANYYVSRGTDGEYSMFENGAMANGTWFDEVINLDMLVNDMHLAVLDLLSSRPKIAQTEGGMNAIKLAIKPSLEKMRQIGFIAPGIWNGGDIWLTPDYCALATGDALPDGYMTLSEPIDTQSQADRDARKAPNIYTPIKLAGAIHTVLVRIDVNR